VDTGKATAAKEQIYCPVFDSKKAIDLALETSEVKAGAHKMALPLSFSNAPVTAQEIAYTEVSPAEIDRDHFSLDNKSVKLQVKITSDSSRDPGYFPAAMTNKEYFALSAVPVGAAMRTPLAILVGRDTGALKVLGRANSADTLSVRGTARLPQDRSVLSIVVDDVEIV
jgi:hypothetical protein